MNKNLKNGNRNEADFSSHKYIRTVTVEINSELEFREVALLANCSTLSKERNIAQELLVQFEQRHYSMDISIL